MRYYVPTGDGSFRPSHLVEMASWIESAGARRPFHEGGQIVGRTELPGGVTVSTVFLGIDHSSREDGRPVLFETMIFGGPHADFQQRYYTLAEAEAGHERAVQLAGSEPPGPRPLEATPQAEIEALLDALRPVLLDALAARGVADPMFFLVLFDRTGQAYYTGHCAPRAAVAALKNAAADLESRVEVPR